jgi:hypothetical protein
MIRWSSGLLLVSFATLLTLPTLSADGQKTEKVEGYAEWNKGGLLVVDGQRVRAVASTTIKGKGRVPQVAEVDEHAWGCYRSSG